MKKTKKLLGIITIAAVMCFGFTACGDGPGGGVKHEGECRAIGSTGDGGGKIFYHICTGFTVKANTGYSAYTAYYLEAAPSDQSTGITWCTCKSSNDGGVVGGSSSCDVTGTGTAIGTGRANTAAIIAHTAHSSNTASNNAAKAANITIGSKSDWFLPSKDELNEMYKARNHLGTMTGKYWSSSQFFGTPDYAWLQDYLNIGETNYFFKRHELCVRAIRAF